MTTTKTYLVGPVNTGKTRALLTLLPEYEDETGRVHKGAGLETFFLTMEPNYRAAIRDHGCRHGLHVFYHSPAPPSWDTVKKFVEILRYKSIADIVTMADPKKSDYQQFWKLFGICENFVCQECHEAFGDVADWGEDRALFFDGLSPLSKIVMEAVIGGKPVSSKPEYYGAQGFLMAFMRLLYEATKCSVITTAHGAREVDPNSGLTVFTLDTIGQRLTPELIKLPEEIILTQRNRSGFSWSTVVDETIQLKRSRLPESNSLQPDFAQIFK